MSQERRGRGSVSGSGGQIGWWDEIGPQALGARDVGEAWDRRGEGRLRPSTSPEARPPQGSVAPATARGSPSTALAPLGDYDGLLLGSGLGVEKSAEVRTSPTLRRAAASPGAWDTNPQPPPSPSGPACVSERWGCSAPPRRDQVPEARCRPNPEEAAAVMGTLPQPTVPPPLRVRTPASRRGRGDSDHVRSRASGAQIRTCRGPPGTTGGTALFKANSPEFVGLKSAQRGRGPVVGAPGKRFSGLRGH
ncbi:hypothetical protein H8959_011188 [Pygathrix nigripes]